LSSVGHTHPVFCLEHVGTKNASHLITISTDGRLCVWSPDKLAQPVEAIELHNKQSKLVTASAPVAVTCVTFPNEHEVNEFFVGSEEGAIYQGFRYGE
jgi:dynein intermediate chain